MPATLYYVHDPMCSWCYGFGPALARLLAALPTRITVVRLLGGLAPDSEEPMTPEMRLRLQQTWQRIQHRIPETRFNHAFWTRCEPKRSTWPACRAVIAARAQDAAFDDAMTSAIQRAYYLEARNPSERDTLIELAREIGADANRFAADLDSDRTRNILAGEMAKAAALGVEGFPSLVLDCDGSRWRIPVDYVDHGPMADLIAELTAF